MDPLRDLDGRDHDPAELPGSLLWDRADAEKAKAAGIATPRQLQLLQRPDLRAHVRRLNQNVAPVVRRAKRDLLNRPELIERRHRREVVRDFGRPPCEARPHYGRRQSRGRSVRRRGSRRATGSRGPPSGDPDEPPDEADADVAVPALDAYLTAQRERAEDAARAAGAVATGARTGAPVAHDA